MVTSTPPKRSVRSESDTIKRACFFDIYDNKEKGASIGQVCKRLNYYLSPSTLGVVLIGSKSLMLLRSLGETSRNASNTISSPSVNGSTSSTNRHPSQQALSIQMAMGSCTGLEANICVAKDRPSKCLKHRSERCRRIRTTDLKYLSSLVALGSLNGNPLLNETAGQAIPDHFTLSRCWRAQNSLKILKRSFEDFRSAIPFKAWSKKFQGAAVTVQHCSSLRVLVRGGKGFSDKFLFQGSR
ncbi:hypothetical protein BJ878DRAFT_529102 [Calycina marina]|uniref:Uncharacterized protein n=1 Tax=Calycina marina TaxID=1763456 RepID=A0A9P7YVG7_9HELO|nr:hypothetical protein BJ878DRAFT_529102 [Calycina marina]